MRDASEASATCSPPRAWTTQSATLRARVAALPWWRERHASLTSVQVGEGARPVCPENVGAPKARTRSAASSAPRVSCQAMAGATGCPSRPRSATVSAMLVTARPTTGPAGASSRAVLTARATASRIANGASSAPVGTGRHGVATLPHETSRPSADTTAAFVIVVPTSTPTRSSSGPDIAQHLDKVGSTRKPVLTMNRCREPAPRPTQRRPLAGHPRKEPRW